MKKPEIHINQLILSSPVYIRYPTENTSWAEGSP